MIVGVIGSGAIGPDLAYGFLSAIGRRPGAKVYLVDIKQEALDAGEEDLPAYLHLASALLRFRSSNSGLAEAALLAAAGTSAAISLIPDSWKHNIRKHATPENAIRAVGTAAVIAGALLSATRTDTRADL